MGDRVILFGKNLCSRPNLLWSKMIGIFGCTCKTINLMQNLHQPSFCLLNTKKKMACRLRVLLLTQARLTKTSLIFFSLLRQNLMTQSRSTFFINWDIVLFNEIEERRWQLLYGKIYLTMSTRTRLSWIYLCGCPGLEKGSLYRLCYRSPKFCKISNFVTSLASATELMYKICWSPNHQFFWVQLGTVVCS